MIIQRDEAFTVVCELLTPVGSGGAAVGTGMFVSSVRGDRQKAWIITASHVAHDTGNSTSVVIAGADGAAQQLPLQTFGTLSGWRHHPVADLSAFPIQFNELNIPFLKGRCLPIDHINLEKKPVSRDYELTCVGFPHGLGTDGMFSPFTFRSYASSGFVTLARADTGTNCVFFCLENPSVGGYSGCPVFDLGYSFNGVMAMSKEQTWCHGFMHGTMSDNTGGKIAMVTPSYYLSDIIA